MKSSESYFQQSHEKTAVESSATLDFEGEVIGSEAESEAQSLFNRLQAARFPDVVDVPPIPLADRITRVSHFCLRKKSNFPNLYSHKEQAHVSVPVQLGYKVKGIETANGGMFLIAETTLPIEPSEEMYQFLQEHSIVPEIYLRVMNRNFGMLGKEADQRSYIEAHAAFAKELGIEINRNRFITEDIYYKQKLEDDPFTCLLALPPNPQRTTAKSRLYARNALRLLGKGLERDDLQVTAETFLADHLTHANGLDYLCLYDMFPFMPGNEPYVEVGSAHEFRLLYQGQDAALLQIQQARQIWHHLTGEERQANFSEMSEATLLRYLASVYAKNGRSNNSNLHFPYFPQTRYGYYVMQGLGAVDMHLVRRNPEMAFAIARAGGVSETLRKSFVDMARINEVVTPIDGSTDLTSFEARHFLHLDGQQKNLQGFGLVHHRDEGISPEHLLGTSLPTGQRIFRGDVFTRPPILSQAHRNGYHTSYVYAPAWALITGQTEPYKVQPHEVIDSLGVASQLLNTPFYQRQLPEAMRLQALRGIEFAQSNIDTVARLEKVTPQLIADVCRPHYRETHTEQYAMRSALQAWVERAAFAGQMYTFTQLAESLGYPIEYEPRSNGDVIRLGPDYRSYPLLANQLKQFHKSSLYLRSELSFVDQKDDMRSYYDAIGRSIADLVASGFSQTKCSVYEYGEGYRGQKKRVWQMSARSKDILAGWGAELDFTSGGSDDMRGVQLVSLFSSGLRQRLEQIKTVDSIEQKHRLLVEAREIAIAFRELYYCEDRFGHGRSAGGRFSYLMGLDKHFNDMEPALTHDRIIPPGELSLPPRTAIVFLGNNMAGKSSIMRSVAYSLLLHGQKVPQPGWAELPDEVRVDSVIGQERQQAQQSLLSIMIKGINRLHADVPNEKKLWLLDELGRRTSHRYGQAILLSTLILGLANRSENTYMLAASHYHSLPRYAPLLKACGIEVQFKVVDGYRHRELKAGERTSSKAFSVLTKYAPGTWLDTWEGEKPRSQQNKPIEQSGKTELSEDEIITTWRDDLFKTEFGYQFPGAGGATLFEIFTQPADGPNHQRAITEIGQMPNLEESIHTLKLMSSLCGIYSRRLDIFEARKQIYALFNIDANTDLKEANDLIAERSNELYEKSQQFVSRVGDILNQQDLHFITPSLAESLTTTALAGMNERTLEYLAGKLYLLASYSTFAHSVTQPESGYCRVTYSDEPKVEIAEMWNPQLSKRSNQVKNAFSIDYDEPGAGIFISGENFSGKSSYIRAVGVATWLAQHTGFAPATSMRINQDLRIISLTQPVSDTDSASSMAVEARDRFRLAVQAADTPEGRHILTLFDEPGAPTSEEDAGHAITALYDWYKRHQTKAKLIVTTHCNQVPEQLSRRDIEVSLMAFRLLSETPFQAFYGTADSNALEVAKKLGLEEIPFQVMCAVESYIKAIDEGGDPQTLASTAAVNVRRAILGLTP